MNKVHGEHTRPTDTPALCLTCNNALRVTGTRFGDDRTICKAGLGLVTFHVTECNGYDDASVTPAWRFEETAWRRWGDRFVSPMEFYELKRAAAQGGAAAVVSDQDEG